MKINILCLVFISCVVGQALAVDLNGTWYTGSNNGTPSLSDPSSNSFTWGTDGTSETASTGSLWSYFPDMTLANDGDAITASFTVTPLDATATAESFRVGLFNDGGTQVLNNLNGTNADAGFLSTLGYFVKWNQTGGTVHNLWARTAGKTNACSDSSDVSAVTLTTNDPLEVLTQGTAYDITFAVARNSATEYLVTSTVNGAEISGTTSLINATAFNTFFILLPAAGIDSLEFANLQVEMILPPDPRNGETNVEVDLLGRTVPGNLSWPAAEYAGATYDIYFGTTEPNFNDPAPYGLSNTLATGASATSIAPAPSPLENLTLYYWVVDSYEPNLVGTKVPIFHGGGAWSFTTIPSDFSPIVGAGSSYVTWLANLPQALAGTVGDFGEGDVADVDVVWSITAYPGDPTNLTMQMIDRIGGPYPADAAILDELETAGYDPNFLGEWIGTDTTDQPGNPLVLTLSGLPSGSYTWISTHHDPRAATGTFDLTVDGVSAGTDIAITDSNTMPVSAFTTPLVSDGSTPVQLVFDSSDTDRFFVMNGFELTDGFDTLKVDFDTQSTGTAIGYQSYRADHEVAADFTAQDFTAFSTTVTVLPEWGPTAAGLITASVTKTSTDPLAPTADFTTNYPGDYTIQLTATDAAAKSDSDTLVVRVGENPCAARQLAPSWPGFNDYDDLGNKNCIVDLPDFAALALEWLDDINLTASEAF